MTGCASAPRADAPLAAIAYKIAATLSFAAMAASIKLLGEAIRSARSSSSARPSRCRSCSAGRSWRAGSPILWATRNIWFHLSRSTVGMAAMFLSFVALADLPLADWTVIGFAMPIFATILAATLLSEPVGPWRGGGGGGLRRGAGHHRAEAQLRPRRAGADHAGLDALRRPRHRHHPQDQRDRERLGDRLLFHAVLHGDGGDDAALRPEVAGRLVAGAADRLGRLRRLGQGLQHLLLCPPSPSMPGAFDHLGLICDRAGRVLLFDEWPDATVLGGAAVIVAWAS